jgi:hypothetical protein
MPAVYLINQRYRRSVLKAVQVDVAWTEKRPGGRFHVVTHQACVGRDRGKAVIDGLSHIDVAEELPPRRPATTANGQEHAIPIVHGQPGLDNDAVVLSRVRVR